MADTPTAPPPLSDDELAPVLQAAADVDRLEDELRQARETYYREVRELTARVPQSAVAARLGISRQRVSELANRPT